MKKETIALRSIGEPFRAFIIDDAFQIDECQSLLAMAEDRGWTIEQTNKYGEKWRDDALRDNQSAYINSTKLANELYSRIARFLPESCGLNKHLRFNAFRGKQKIAPHVDGEYESFRNATMSKMTFILYLNDVKNGGETRFLNAETMKHIDVEPTAGRVLLFDQRLCHAALPVRGSGVKFTLRSDVLYKEQ